MRRWWRWIGALGLGAALVAGAGAAAVVLVPAQTRGQLTPTKQAATRPGAPAQRMEMRQAALEPTAEWWEPLLEQSRRDARTEEERPQPRRASPILRTYCVRLCDGYYFPLSHAASRAKLGIDAQRCDQACPGNARLFSHVVGQSVDDMIDANGRPYRLLDKAYVYRTTYDATCRCQPQPWSAEAAARHRAYAEAEQAQADKTKQSLQTREGGLVPTSARKGER